MFEKLSFEDAALVALANNGEICDMKTFNCPKCGKTFEERRKRKRRRR
jgi:predicted RNA-binding Zn-ribbon protein involved in translation (DUF1610 family)